MIIAVCNVIYDEDMHVHKLLLMLSGMACQISLVNDKDDKSQIRKETSKCNDS